jgi:hypothetical protein
VTRRVAAALVASALLLAPMPTHAARADDAVRLPGVTSEGVPRGLVTVVVPIPAELRDEAEITYEVRLSGEIEILGRLRGAARTGGAPARPLILTLRVPALADAGELNAAEVHFRSASGREFVVPLILRVAVVRAVTLLGSREVRNLRAGDRLAMAYRVVNAGNAADSVRITVRGPVGWAARLDRPAIAIVPARSELAFTVSIGIPTAVNVGDHVLSVAVLEPATGDVHASIYTTIGITGRAGPAGGLVVKPTIATAVTSAGSTTFTGLEVSGAVSHDLKLRLNFTPGRGRESLTSQGLSAVGALDVPFSATLSGADWTVAAGNTSVQLSELAGMNVVGRGLTGEKRNDDVEAKALLALSGSQGGRDDGFLAGAGYWRDTRYGRMGGAASFLAEGRGGLGRELRAISADYRTPAIGTMVLGASLGHRTGGGTHGAAYGVSATHVRPTERLAFRASHAPGGTAAFARAVDELQFEGSRILTKRWIVDASGQRSWDAAPGASSMAVTSWSIGQRVAATTAIALTTRAQGSGFRADANGGAGAFGADDRDLGVGVEWRRSLLAFSAEVAQGTVERSTELLSGTLDVSTAAQRRVRFSATRGSERWGVIDGSVSLDQTASGVGIPGEMWMSRARWSELPIRVGTRVVRAESELVFQRLGDLRSSVVWRSGLQAALPGGFDIELSAERNPFFRDRNGRAAWIAALRISASARVYSPRSMGPEGIVWEDRDLDGLRDATEPGVAGVVVRRGDAKATTDLSGRYRLPVDARGTSRIDQASLPIGLIAHPMLANDTIERLDIPVLPTGSVEVDFTPVADDDGRLPTVDLEPTVVILRDAAGFEWVGRRSGATSAKFDGIPVGEYTVAMNLTRLREPLRYEEGVRVTVDPRVPATVKVPLRLRAIRLFTPPRSRGGRSQ